MSHILSPQTMATEYDYNPDEWESEDEPKDYNYWLDGVLPLIFIGILASLALGVTWLIIRL